MRYRGLESHCIDVTYFLASRHFVRSARRLNFGLPKMETTDGVFVTENGDHQTVRLGLRPKMEDHQRCFWFFKLKMETTKQ